MSWSYIGHDVGIVLFDACLRAGAPMTLTPGMKVLEVGCCESDWLERAQAAWPGVEFAGIDVRADKHNRPYRWKRNAMDHSIFQPYTFDAIVSLSAIEHMGLGHYGDPAHPDGDQVVMANCARWLKPGGWMYLDVPYDPSGYRVQGTKCRVYDGPTAAERLMQGGVVPQWFGFVAHATPGTLIEKPVTPVQPFHYVAMVVTKPNLPGIE